MRYKKGDTLKQEDIQKISAEVANACRSIILRKDPIRPGQTVYFDRNCDSPRRAFKADYPENKITYDPNEADIIIADDNVKYYSQNYSDIFQFWPVGSSRWNPSYHTELVLEDSKRIDIANKIMEKKDMVESGKPYVSDKMIKMAATFGRKMEGGEKEQIGKLISSADPEMAQLGLNLLMSFDMEENEEEFALAFLRMRHTYLLSSTRVMKAMKSKLKAKYVNLHI